MSLVISDRRTRATRDAYSSYIPRVDDPLTPGVPDGLSGSSLRVLQGQEKRQYPRRSLHCPAALIDERGGEHAVTVISAQCSNVSNGGLFAIVPMGHGIAIGQRRTFRLALKECGPEASSENIVSQEGEVVRVELMLGEDGYADQIGIGVRLFGPRAGLLPTPLTA